MLGRGRGDPVGRPDEPIMQGKDDFMDVVDAIRTVLAVRSYKDTPVPDEVIREILEAGRLTASAGNRQPWNFVVVTDRDVLQALADHSEGHGPYVNKAAFAVAVVVDKTTLGISDASRAIQSMVLAAWVRGVGSNWVGFSDMLTEINPILGIPEDLDVVAVLPFGYPADESLGKGIKKRKPLEEIVHWGSWGQHDAPDSAT